MHVYKSIWTPFLGEVLQAEMEEGNEEDRYAVAILKNVAILKDGGVVVGHAPRSFSRTFYFFLRHGGSTDCKSRGIESSELGWKCRARGKPKYIKRLVKFLTKADSDKQDQTLS